MTVKDAISVLRNANTISLGYGDNVVPFDKDNPLSVDAFGEYIVDEIRSDEGGYYEISIVMRPVKVGDV